MELGSGTGEGPPPPPPDQQAPGGPAGGLQAASVDAHGLPPYGDAAPLPGYAPHQGFLEAHQAPPPPEPPQEGAPQQWLPQEGQPGHVPPAEAQQVAVDPWVRLPERLSSASVRSSAFAFQLPRSHAGGGRPRLAGFSEAPCLPRQQHAHHWPVLYTEGVGRSVPGSDGCVGGHGRGAR